MKLSIFNLLILTLLAFSACKKDDLNKEVDKELCFEFIYPITYTMPDGATVTGDNEAAVELALKDWYEAHPDSKADAELEYPVGVKFNEGDSEIFTLNNKEDFLDLKKDCGEDDVDKDVCFELVYPVTYTMPDESNITGNNEEEVWVAIKTWYENHPDVAAKPALNYPVGITFGEGNDAVEVVTDELEMETIKEDCKGDDWDKNDCFDFVYPVTYIMPDDSEITGSDEEELWAAVKTWYENHPDVAAEPTLQYPVGITFGVGNDAIEVVNNEAEMEAIKEDCKGDDWDKDACFDLVYPITFVMPDDSEITGNDEEALWTAVKTWYENHPDVDAKPELQYPVEIVFEDSTTQAIEDEAEMETAKEDCE